MQRIRETSRSPVTSGEFRKLLGTLPTGVAVLVTRDVTGTPIGLTVSAVASVSLTPPILLVCVHRLARIRGLLHEGSTFALNVLSASQADLSRRFASPVTDRFVGVDHEVRRGEVVIGGAVGHITCMIREIAEMGDHSVVYADVVGGEVNGRRPLVHCRGRYTSPSDDASSSAP